MSYAWVTSARDQFAVDLLDAARDAAPTAQLRVVISEGGPFSKCIRRRSDELDAHFIALPEKPAQHETVILQETKARAIDFLFLGGYMKRVPKTVRDSKPCLNLHPAPPWGPVGKWQDVTWGLIATEASQTGCVVHIVTEEMDRGPVVSFCLIPIRGPDLDGLWAALSTKVRRQGGLAPVAIDEGESEPLFRAIREQQFACEAPLVALTLELLTRQDATLSQSGLSLDGKLQTAGVNLTDQVRPGGAVHG